MQTTAAIRSGKTFRGENFPVASRLIKARHRRPILAFYDFVRTADDVADSQALLPDEKLARLEALENSLRGKDRLQTKGVALRQALADCATSPKHALDLLAAFRLDVSKKRYDNWEELIDYCRLSAMPVGRHVLDVHGELRALWPASDALCAALQIINHLQDCADDYRVLDRVYIPLDMLRRRGAGVVSLAGPQCSPELRACLDDLCDRVAELLRQSAPLALQVRQARLALEISVIQRLAEQLVWTLRRRDPLRERCGLRSTEILMTGVVGVLGTAARRALRAPLQRLQRSQTRAVGHRDQVKVASRSTFFLAMRILPADRRAAIFSIYGFCRAVDDIADENGDRTLRLRALERWRRDIGALYDGRAPESLQTLAKSVRAYGLRREDLLAVIDGMQMDVDQDIFAPGHATLDLYCDRVASAAGRLCIRVFGMSEEPGFALAYHLGRALQLTNILRDLDEDGTRGRLYLPQEFLQAAGIEASCPRQVLNHPALHEPCDRMARLACRHFEAADAVMASAPAATVRCARVMAGAYQALLASLQQRGWSTPRAPVRLRRRQVAVIAMKSLLGR